MGPSFTPVQPRAAASVILLRSPDEVYMTRRPTTLRVAAGFYVFPGGHVDAQDRTLAGATSPRWHVPALDSEYGPFVAAAVREVFEEVGLLLAVDEGGRNLWQAEGATVHADVLQVARDRLNRDEVTLFELLQEHRWTVAADTLAYVSRWVTPPAARRRFDTRFFVADVTGCIAPQPDPGEVSRAEWIPLRQTLARDEAGTLPLMRPTKALLHTLASVGGTSEIVDYYKRIDSERLEVVERNTPEVLESVLASQGVTVIPIPSPTLLPATATNVYMIVRGAEAVLVDAGDGGEAGVELVVEAWERAGRPRLNALVLTHNHPDHAGALRPLLQRLRCPLAAHVAGRHVLQERYGLTLDIELHGGEQFHIGRRRLEAIHSPGHAADHISLYERETGLLFSGDNVVGAGSTWVGPPDGDMDDYLGSLRRLQTLSLSVIAPGHGRLLDEPQRRIQTLVDRRLAREAEILALIRERPHTVADIFEQLYEGVVAPSVAEMARRTVLGHIIKLERDGVVRQIAAPEDEAVKEVLYGPV